MIVIAAVAIYGAAAGLWMRPPLRAVVFAAISVAGVQYAAIWLAHFALQRPGLSGVALAVQTYAGADIKGLVPTASTAAFAAALTAFIAALTQSSERRRRVRRVAAIEE